MAYFRASLGIVGKSDGGRAMRRTAYLRCTVADAFDFSSKAPELQHCGVIIPTGSDPKYMDPDMLWPEVEATETRVNSIFARTLEIAIPDAIPERLHDRFAKDLLTWITVEYDLPLEWAIHKDRGHFRDDPNFHIHASIATRGLDANGWLKKKDRAFKTLCSKSRATGGKIPLRGIIADKMNAWMSAHNIDATVTAQANADRDLVIPNMPKSVVKAFQRYQAAALQAHRDGVDPPEMPAWLDGLIAQHRAQSEAVRQVRSAQDHLETILKLRNSNSPVSIEGVENDRTEQPEPNTGAGEGRSQTSILASEKHEDEYGQHPGETGRDSGSIGRRPPQADDGRNSGAAEGDGSGHQGVEERKQGTEGYDQRTAASGPTRLQWLRRRIVGRYTVRLLQLLFSRKGPTAIQRIKRRAVGRKALVTLQQIRERLNDSGPTKIQKLRRDAVGQSALTTLAEIREELDRRGPTRAQQIKRKQAGNAALRQLQEISAFADSPAPSSYDGSPENSFNSSSGL